MPFDAAALLRHRDFVRAVAGRLLDDPHLVDDVEQETWATALGRPPRSPGALAAWLGQVARRLAFRALRSRERRVRRERAASPPRPPTTPDELAQALETQQRLVEAVLRLDRPYREVVLLRFYEGLAPRETAARLKVPVDTVRTRTRRALDLLRADLERGPGGRRAWSLGLLPLLVPPRAARWTIGALLMATKTKFAAVAALLLFSGAVAWQLAPRASAPRATTSPAVVSETPPAAASMCRLTGRVVDGQGQPIADARVELSVTGLDTVTDLAGAFAFETAQEGDDVVSASSGALRAQQAVELKYGDVSAGTLVLAESVTVTGIVLGVGGEGASGAVVEAWPQMIGHPLLADNPLAWAAAPPPIAASTVSGEGGTFRLALPRGAAMVLRARKGDAMTREEQGYDLHEDTGLIVLRLRTLAAIRGRVVDLSGAPVAGARVDLVPPPWSYERNGHNEVRSVRGVRTITAADGSFALAALPEVYGVLVTHPDRAPFHAARVLAPREGWTIRLSPGRLLEGVVEAAGRPAPRVQVRLVPTDGNAGPQETWTDDAGKFAFAHAAIDRPFHLFADGDGLGTALLRDVEWRGEPLRVALDPASDVVGRVVLEDGTPVGGVRLQTWEFMVRTETTQYIRGYREAVSGPDGRFRFEGASRCNAASLHPAEDRYVLLGPNDIPRDGREAMLKVAPLRRLTVHVADADGIPLAGAEVSGRAFTDGDGTCRLFAPPYATELVATKPGWRGVGRIPDRGEEVRIVLARPPVFRGVVRDAAGAPLADVRVQARQYSEKASYWLYETAFTGRAGEFAIDVPEDIGLHVTLERTGFVSAIEKARPREEPWEFRLQPSLALAGRVVDEEGKPIAGAAVESRRVVTWSQTTWTAADGRFVLDDIDPGQRLRLRAPGYASRDLAQTDPKGEGEQVFVLARELVITGQILKGDGAPAPFAVVHANPEEPGAPSMATQADAGGKFRIPALSAGRYTLAAELYQSDAEWEPMAGVAAGTTGVVLREKPPQVLAGLVLDEKDRALRGARVNLFDAAGDFVKGDYVDDGGRFRIPVRSGKYEVRVNLAGMAFKKMHGVESGREDLVLRFAVGPEIRGQLVSPEGVAPGSASVEIWSDDMHGYAEVDRSGGFAIRGLHSGTYDLRGVAAPRGGGQAMRGTARAAAGGDDIRIELAKVEGRR